jgi:hypothetical protein
MLIGRLIFALIAVQETIILRYRPMLICLLIDVLWQFPVLKLLINILVRTSLVIVCLLACLIQHISAMLITSLEPVFLNATISQIHQSVQPFSRCFTAIILQIDQIAEFSAPKLQGDLVKMYLIFALLNVLTISLETRLEIVLVCLFVLT